MILNETQEASWAMKEWPLNNKTRACVSNKCTVIESCLLN